MTFMPRFFGCWEWSTSSLPSCTTDARNGPRYWPAKWLRRSSHNPVRIAALFIVLYAGSIVAQDSNAGADLPAGPGKPTVLKICGDCHGVDKFAFLRKSKPDWDFVINKMSDEGLELTDEEYESIIGYLLKYLGP